MCPDFVRDIFAFHIFPPRGLILYQVALSCEQCTSCHRAERPKDMVSKQGREAPTLLRKGWRYTITLAKDDDSKARNLNCMKMQQPRYSIIQAWHKGTNCAKKKPSKKKHQEHSTTTFSQIAPGSRCPQHWIYLGDHMRPLPSLLFPGCLHIEQIQNSQ